MNVTDHSSGIVRAKFDPGSPREYHAICSEARIGDKIQCKGWSMPATVVGYGRSPKRSTEPRPATVVKRAPRWSEAIAAVDWAKGLNDGGTISYHTADVKFTGAFREALAAMTPNEIREHYAMNSNGTITIQDDIDRTEEKLRALKAAKKARKAERKAAKRAADEKARQLKVVTDTLEEVAANDHIHSAQRIAAAVELNRIIVGF